MITCTLVLLGVIMAVGKQGEEKMTRLSITVPESMDRFIREYSKQQKRSVSAQIQLLIEQLQQELEKQKDDTN